MYLQRAVNRMNAKQAGKKLSADDYSELANLRQNYKRQRANCKKRGAKVKTRMRLPKRLKTLKKQILKISGELYILNLLLRHTCTKSVKGEKALQEANGQLKCNSRTDTCKLVRQGNAWRYMAMLANPTTHIRNIFG